MAQQTAVQCSTVLCNYDLAIVIEHLLIFFLAYMIETCTH